MTTIAVVSQLVTVLLLVGGVSLVWIWRRSSKKGRNDAEGSAPR